MTLADALVQYFAIEDAEKALADVTFHDINPSVLGIKSTLKFCKQRLRELIRPAIGGDRTTGSFLYTHDGKTYYWNCMTNSPDVYDPPKMAASEVHIP